MLKKIATLFVLLVVLISCAPQSPTFVPSVTLELPVAATETSTPMPAALWVSPAVPTGLSAALNNWSIPRTDDPSLATVRLEPVNDPQAEVKWVYALVAPFPTLVDDVSSADVLHAWQGDPSGPFAGHPLWMSESTLAAFTAMLGAPAAGAVQTAPADQLLDSAWAALPSWGIVPFEELSPRWKVLSVDGESPIHKHFDPSQYHLIVDFKLSGEKPAAISIPSTNRDPSKMTVMILTGTTAMVDAMGVVMERKGPTYPGKYIRDWTRDADILHISNEVPFDKDCPFPNPGNRNLSILCSRPNNLDLLLDIGTDVIELTGEHFNNRGTAAMLSTLQTYRDHNLPTYGGGANMADAMKPITLEDHGNKFMFIGCNMKQNYRSALATATTPGAAPCEFAYMTAQIKDYKARGYIPIVTYQDYEYYSPEPRLGQMRDFRTMADAGAVLVSGSQGHYPQVMEFYNGVFLHYALGNLFYTQMSYTLPDGSVTDRTRWEFLDRHVFYDGKYISTELLTAMLEDFSTPRPMTGPERVNFLNLYFSYSGWMGITPTPPPAPTITLTPISYPTFAGTPLWPPSPTATVTPKP
jgi:poly-gamma-glutamate synthesis protein (capsule biosynthesis protein)